VKLFKNSKFEFMRAFDRTPCEQKIQKNAHHCSRRHPVRPWPPQRTRRRPLPLRCRAPIGEARTPAGGQRKSSSTASLSPDQQACLLAVAEVSERCQHASGGAASPTTRPLDQTSSTEPQRPENFPAPATSGNPSSRPLPSL
jgi:hypothetical protein